ncbi:MAG: hypothetical protein GF311_07680 [Candidatus Lokiarchaeota archaeon]|nr:hypothetical protein [Candidatus Lokiarchaeota archaeon]
MSSEKYKKELLCPECGSIGAIYVLKVIKDKTILKQRCPDHGSRKYKLPLNVLKDLYPEIIDAIYRCYYCGDKINPNHIKQSDPWTLVKGDCEIHGKKLPYQKIWASVYSDLKDIEIHPKDEEENHKESLEMVNCPNCGTEFKKKPDQDYCEFCLKKVK